MANKKMWYLYIADFVGNEEDWLFEDRTEAYKSFSLILHKELVNDEIKNKDGELIDMDGKTFGECLEKGVAETRMYHFEVRECEVTTMRQFMW